MYRITRISAVFFCPLLVIAVKVMRFPLHSLAGFPEGAGEARGMHQDSEALCEGPDQEQHGRCSLAAGANG